MTLDTLNKEYSRFVGLVHQNNSLFHDPFDKDIELDLFNVNALTINLRCLQYAINSKLINFFEFEAFSKISLFSEYNGSDESLIDCLVDPRCEMNLKKNFIDVIPCMNFL